MSTSGNASGREAIVKKMTDTSGKVFRESTWLDAEILPDGSVKIAGIAPGGNGSPILVFTFQDDKIARLHHQFYTARIAGSRTDVKLTDEIIDRINNSLARHNAIVVAT